MNQYNPNYYANLKDDAAMIQAAVDAASKTGAKITIPRRNERTGKDIWIISTVILLYSGSTICLDNCHLRLEDDTFTNMFKNSNGRTEKAGILAGRQYDIRIYGHGNAVIDGGMHNGLVERNQLKNGRPAIINNTLMHFHNAERITIENIRILNPRWWCMTFHYCSGGRISNIDFMGTGNAPNQDGIDLRTGCNSFIIENITGMTQDDTIALTNLSHKYGASLGVKGLDNSIHNVVIRNITTATRCASVRLLNHGGGKLYNVIIENIQSFAEIDPADSKAGEYEMRIPHGREYYAGAETSMALLEPYWSGFKKDTRPSTAVRIGENHYYDPDKPSSKAKLNDTFNITVRNIQSRAKYAVMVSCTLADSVIDNVQMFGDPITAVYFNEGVYRNIRVNNISFPAVTLQRPDDEKISAVVYFNNADVSRMSFSGITTALNHKSVFAGFGKVELKARDINLRSKETVLINGEGIEMRD